LALFTSGRARLIDSARLVAQFAALERRTFPTGRDRVDHGRSGRDDAANSAAGALVLAARNVAQPVRFPEAFTTGQPRNIPGGGAFTPNPYAAPNPQNIPRHYLKSGQEPSRLVGDGRVYDRWSNRNY
jgi:hypothetical protein